MKKADDDILPPLTGLTEELHADELNRAIESFRSRSSSVESVRLYEVYRKLKGIIDSSGPGFASQSSYFNDLFLRILEERGESGSGIYRTVLRDSSEFRLLSWMLVDSGHPELPAVEDSRAEPAEPAPPERPSLKKILSMKGADLFAYPEEEWRELVKEHFASATSEKLLVKNCTSVVSAIMRSGEYREYHLEAVIQHVFGELKVLKEISFSTKGFAMKMLNCYSWRGEVWRSLHSHYLEIIRI